MLFMSSMNWLANEDQYKTSKRWGGRQVEGFQPYLGTAGMKLALMESDDHSAAVELVLASSGKLEYQGKVYDSPDFYPQELVNFLQGAPERLYGDECDKLGFRVLEDASVRIQFVAHDKEHQKDTVLDSYDFEDGMNRYSLSSGGRSGGFSVEAADLTLQEYAAYLPELQSFQEPAEITKEDRHAIETLSKIYVDCMTKMYTDEGRYSEFYQDGGNSGHGSFIYNLAGDYFKENKPSICNVESWDGLPSCYLGGYCVYSPESGPHPGDGKAVATSIAKKLETIYAGKDFEEYPGETCKSHRFLRATLKHCMDKARTWEQQQSEEQEHIPFQRLTTYASAKKLFDKGVAVYDDGHQKLCFDRRKLPELIASVPSDVRAKIYDADHGLLLTTAGNFIQDNYLPQDEFSKLREKLIPLQLGEKSFDGEIPCFPVQKVAKILYRRNLEGKRDMKSIGSHPWEQDGFELINSIGNFPSDPIPPSSGIDGITLGDNLAHLSVNDMKEILAWEYGGDNCLAKENYGLTSEQVLSVLSRDNRVSIKPDKLSMGMYSLVVNFVQERDASDLNSEKYSGREKILCLPTTDKAVKALSMSLTNNPNLSPIELSKMRNHSFDGVRV